MTHRNAGNREGKGDGMSTTPATPTTDPTPWTSPGKEIKISGHIYTVMGGSPSYWLLHKGPVEPADPRHHRFCGSDCDVRGF